MQRNWLTSKSTPSAIGIVAANFHGRARATAFAAFSAGAPVGGGLGNVLGGVLVSYTKLVLVSCKPTVMLT
jgi:MFS family permease